MKPFLFGKKVHTAPALHIGHNAHGSSPAIGHVTPATKDKDGSKLEVIKEGGKVVRLILTCGCGERVEVNCLYSPGD